MKYWFEYTKKYQIPKPITWHGWLCLIGYAILVFVVVTLAVSFLDKENGLLYYILTLIGGIFLLSGTFSIIRNKKIDPSTKVQKISPKIKGGKKKKY